MAKFHLLTAFLVAAFFCFSATAEQLQIAGGKIIGKITKSETGVDVKEFLGIRYGKSKRYEKPTLVESWSGVEDATQFKAACHQFGFLAALTPHSAGQSEDCLFLNVWEPTSKNGSSAKKPVMVFIHGGAFEGGSGEMEGKDLAALGDVVVVTINYRLGPLGFMMGGDIPANLGLHDQILALKWVALNAHFFGGDAQQVTIFGESAGSISVGALILSPLAKGLFRRAILQSGSPAVEVLGNSKTRALEKTVHLGGKVNCTETAIDKLVACIKKVSLDALKEASGDDFLTNNFFVPTYGDDVLPMKPSEALKNGHFAKDVDVIYGTTRDEGSIFALFIVPELMTSTDINKSSLKLNMAVLLKKYNVDHQQEIIDYYVSKVTANFTQDDYKILMSSVFGDYALVCPTVLFGEEMARHASPNSRFYAYRLMEYKSLAGNKWMGVTHGADVQYLFSLATTKADPELYELSKDIIHAWTSFAKTGVPGKMGSVEWAEAVGGNKAVKDYRTKYMSLEVNKFKMVDRFYEATCDGFWKPKLFA